MPEQNRPSPADLPLFAARQSDRPAARALAGSFRKPSTSGGGSSPARPRAGHAGSSSGPATPPTLAPSHLGAATEHSAPGAPVDWSTVSELRAEVSERIRGILDPGEALDTDRHGPAARELIGDSVRSYTLRQISLGRPALDVAEQSALSKAVFDAIFGLGRIQPLLDQPGLVDIEIRGYDNVTCLFDDGRIEYVDPVADSNEQLTREIQLLAAHGRGGERSFSAASPLLDLSLPDGSRLSATGWVTPVPTVTIRKHPLVDIDLWDLVEMNSVDEVAAALLEAAMQAGRSGCVSGLPAAGKTTFARAWLNCLHPDTPIATIETEYELHLNRLAHRHRRVWAAESRPGGGERDSRGDVIGEVSLTDLVRHALRQNVDRIVVGEVRGREVLDMLEAMTAGKGSLSTIHATGVAETVERIVGCALRAGEAGDQVSPEYAYRQVGTHIDLIVHLGVIDQSARGGRKHRFVRAISAVTLGEQQGTGIALTSLYEPGPDGRAVPTGLLPDWIDDLREFGFDPNLLTDRVCHYKAPLDVLPPAPLRHGRQEERMSALLGAVLGLLVAGGLLLVIVGATPTEPAPARPRRVGPWVRARRRLSRRHLAVVTAAGVLGVVIAALSGWVIAIVVLPVAALAAPTLMSRNHGAAAIAQMEALEEWVRALRGVISAGMPLTEGIVRTLDSSPAAIRPQVEMLVARLQARRPVDQALYAFADELDDPLGDLVASSLIIGAAESGVGLSKVLESLAGMLTKKVRSRRRIESDRAGVRNQARMVIIIVAVTFPLYVTQTQFGAVYHSPGGQVMLAVFCALFGLCFWWLHRRASFEPLPRFLITPRQHRIAPAADGNRS